MQTADHLLDPPPAGSGPVVGHSQELQATNMLPRHSKRGDVTRIAGSEHSGSHSPTNKYECNASNIAVMDVSLEPDPDAVSALNTW
jgi:hypothetical protein